MRGKAPASVTDALPPGITPAHAGKSSQRNLHFRQLGDHPRTCGEKPRGGRLGKPAPGSPPHMRGKDAQYTAKTCETGITPAHAGKSYHCFARRALYPDHPRTCGEKVRASTLKNRHAGSPPHMRGKEEADPARGAARGITPAHAGKSITLALCPDVLRDHPRTCGEKRLLR